MIMNNPFPFSSDSKRYHTWNYHLQTMFGKKVCKIPLNAGFTCPNRDGLKGVGGCTFCSGNGSGDFAGNPQKSLAEQFESVKVKQNKKWPDAVYIAYFQAFTNTYAPVGELREKYEQVLCLRNVVGLSIATRADCLSDDVVDYLYELSRRTYLVVELGLQSANDETAARINRGHTWMEFLDGYRRLQSRGIYVCVHIINGLPGETSRQMMETAKQVAALKPHCVKLHLLHVLKGTLIAEQYINGDFPLLELAEYVNIICNQLEIIPAETVIQRLTGDGAKDVLIGPKWSLKKFVVLNEIDKELVRRNSWQGKYAKEVDKDGIDA